MREQRAEDNLMSVLQMVLPAEPVSVSLEPPVVLPVGSTVSDGAGLTSEMP